MEKKVLLVVIYLNFLKKNIAVYIASYEKFITNTKKIDYDYIINCSSNKECFTLNNKKLMNEIKIKNDLKELKNEYLEISKKFFLNK